MTYVEMMDLAAYPVAAPWRVQFSRNRGARFRDHSVEAAEKINMISTIAILPARPPRIMRSWTQPNLQHSLAFEDQLTTAAAEAA